MTTPLSTDTKTDYENFSVTCPSCKFWNIFNRVTDLKTTTLITFREVMCEECKTIFAINGDNASEKWSYLLFECYDYLQSKRYMQCVLNTAQALEAFFYLAIKKKLLFDPRINQVIGNSEFNELSKKLYENIENNTCPDLYKIFKRLYYETINLDTKEKIIDVIKNIKKLGKDFDETITHVWKLRCRVGRKEAYRPTKEEAEKCIAFARKAIMKFAIDFKISTPIQFWPQGSLK